MNGSYFCDRMPSRLEIVDLMGEKEEDDRLGASKFVAKKPYQGLLVYSLSSRDPRLFEDIKATVRDQMYSVGASLEQNDQDRTGDGDQSPIIDSNAQQVYEELFRSGGDFDAYLLESLCGSSSGLSEFATHCVAGRHRKVQQMLERNSLKHGKSLDVLIQLLETRETALRLTPLLLVFCMLRSLAMVDDSAGDCGTPTAMFKRRFCSVGNGTQDNYGLEYNLLRVVIVLLQYGARPDAKDVTGRTVCYYGAGTHASDSSMTATTMCIGAAISAHCFGKEVVLREMDDSADNGMRGIAAGYQAETGRRIVYLFGRKAQIAVMNRNIRLVQQLSHHNTAVVPPPKKPFNLCDVQDRFGCVCLAKLFDSKRVDVATFLMVKHEASIDIPDWNGNTLRSLSLNRGSMVANGVAPLIAAEAMKRAFREHKQAKNTCSACGSSGTKECSLRVCQPCMSVRFCSNDCQAAHWKVGHRKECPKLRKLYRECVVIDKPSTSKGDVADNAILTYNAGEVPMTSYRRPSYVAVDEAFTVKVQRISGRDTLLVYDRSRECEFCLGPEQSSYRKLLEKVKAEQVTAGTKAYMAAAFDKTGNCTFYVNQTKMKTW